MAPPADSAPIQFGSINQPSNTPLPSTTGRTGDVPNLRSSEVQFGSLSAADTNQNRSQIRAQPQQRQSPQAQQQQQQHQQSQYHHNNNNNNKPEIPRSPRTTNDGRLFTQPYAPRQNINQGEYNNNNNNRYYNNNSNGIGNGGGNNTNYRNNYGRPPQQGQHLPPQRSPQQQQQQQHSPQTLPPSPMSVNRASPNMNTYQKKNSLSPHIPHSSPQNIQMTASWSPGQYYYPQYPVTVSPYNVIPTSRSPIIPPPAPRKVIAIIDPATGNALNTNTRSLASVSPVSAAATVKGEEKLDFKVPVPHVSKAVVIVDPAIRDRELREKKEREEAEQEALRKAEEEKKEKERLEKERLEKEEADRIEAERREAERVEAERIETERRLKAEADAIAKAEAEAEQKRLEEEEVRKKAEEEELKRVLAEVEAKKRREEQDRIIAAEVAAQKIGRVPTTLDMSTVPKFTHSTTASPAVVKKCVTPMKLIEDPSKIQYPAGIQAPTSKLESDGKLTYSIEFLLHFQQLCLDTNVDLSEILKEMSNTPPVGRGGNHMNARQPSDRGRSPRTPGASNMGGDSMFRMGSRDGRMEMGKFNMGRPLTARTGSSHMERQGSRGGGVSNRGGRGGSGMKVFRNPSHVQGGPTIPMDQVAPLEKSENRWVPATQAANPIAAPTAEDELMTQEFITRKVNALLNKLTVEKFDSISSQIFDYAKQSAKEVDGRSIRTVIKLTFEKACDEPAFASMWARLCRSMYDSMTDDIRDTSILNEAEQPSSGVLLYRKYLFNRCQVEFEKGWKVNMPEVDEVDGMMTEEYYIAAKAKRQGLGLIQFIGELFKLDMLSERIMYNCMIRLCNNAPTAGDEEAESLCKLLTTVGKNLDHKPKTSKWVDIIFRRMREEMLHSPNLTSRLKFMIQDVVDLRKDKWVPRSGGAQVGPTTIAKIHEQAEKAKEEKEAAMKRNNSSRGQYIPNNNQYNNNNNMARTGSYRGGRDQHHFQPHNNNNNNGGNNGHHNGDGWSTVGSNPSPGGGVGNKSRTHNDLTNFGKTDRSRSRTTLLGPGTGNSPFPSLSRGKSAINTESKSSGDGRSSPATNMFSALEKSDERKKLNLAPRSAEVPAAQSSEAKLSEEDVKRKSKNILEEYFNVRDKKELSECVEELEDPQHRVIFIGEMLTVVEKKAADVDRMIQVVEYLESENLLQRDQFVKAFKTFMEGYDDLTIDVPQAPKYVAQLLLASSITPEEVDNEGFASLKSAYDKVKAETK
ncbi:unnamed protein product [Mucor hiemalis]